VLEIGNRKFEIGEDEIRIPTLLFVLILASKNPGSKILGSILKLCPAMKAMPFIRLKE